MDTVIDCVGSSGHAGPVVGPVRRGGTIVEIGVPGPDVAVNVPVAQIPLTGKRLIGCVYGGSSVFRDIPATSHSWSPVSSTSASCSASAFGLPTFPTCSADRSAQAEP